MRERKRLRLNQVRYQDNPIYLFFEYYILNTIGELPDAKSESLDAMELHKIFNTDIKNWKAIVHKILDLSETIDISIMDLWIRNSKIAADKNLEYDPRQYAKDFVDNYYKEGSRVDIWDPQSLQEAAIRIAEYKKIKK